MYVSLVQLRIKNWMCYRLLSSGCFEAVFLFLFASIAQHTSHFRKHKIIIWKV